MDHEQIKQQVIENAWGGFNMDYGLLHVQLATPIITVVIILILMVALNKLLFQPVLQTLDKRNNTIDENNKISESAKKEIVRLKKEYEEKQGLVRLEISSILRKSLQEAVKQKDEVLMDAKKIAEAELEKESKILANEKKLVIDKLEPEKDIIAALVVKKLIS